ncbi:MAG: O-antigen ligase family protein [Polaromonas sp.]|nr:O-antigen ligase family protein [Polaromonas sp.]
MPKIPIPALSFRLVVVGLMAVSVGLPMAIISLSKALVLLFVVGIAFCLFRERSPLAPLTATATPAAIAIALVAMGLSVSWSEAPAAQAWGAWAKHAKLLLIPLLLLLIRSEREARLALLSFVAAQTALLLGSWLLWARVPVPWATSNRALVEYAVFSSRLDQPIMSGVTAAICWHLREFAPGRWGRTAAVAVVVMALVNVIFVMNGRTGHLVAIALISLALMWELPRPYRVFAGAMPFLVLLAVWLGSATVRERMDTAVQELHSYTKIGSTDSSSGERLNYWHRSVESILQHPVAGAGVGSWNAEYQRLDQGRGPVNAQNVRNPHQEFLLWGVEAGMIGLALLCNVLLAVWRDTRRMSVPAARATQSVLAALVVACMFNSSLFDATIGDFFCVVLALVLALGWHARAPSATALREATA